MFSDPAHTKPSKYEYYLFTNCKTMETNKTVQFIYNFQNFDGQPSKIEHPIVLPYRGDVRELSHEIVSKEMDPIMKMLDAHEGDTNKGRQIISSLNKNLNCRVAQTFENIH